MSVTSELVHKGQSTDLIECTDRSEEDDRGGWVEKNGGMSVIQAMMVRNNKLEEATAIKRSARP